VNTLWTVWDKQHQGIDQGRVYAADGAADAIHKWLADEDFANNSSFVKAAPTQQLCAQARGAKRMGTFTFEGSYLVKSVAWDEAEVKP